MLTENEFLALEDSLARVQSEIDRDIAILLRGGTPSEGPQTEIAAILAPMLTAEQSLECAISSLCINAVKRDRLQSELAQARADGPAWPA